MTLTIAATTEPGMVHAIGVYEGNEVSTDPEVFDRLGTGQLALLAAAGFTGKLSQVTAVSEGEQVVYVVGLGAELDHERLREAAGWLARSVGRVPELTTSLHRVDLDGAAQAVAEGFLLGQYDFTEYHASDIPGTGALLMVGEVADAELDRARSIATTVSWARDLVNRPPRDKSPQLIVEAFETLVGDLPIDITIWDVDDLIRERCGGLLGVNAGSTAPARMVIAEYNPESYTQTLAVVGKGIVFDSGGLNIKTYEFMKTMKSDMAGAAATLAGLVAIAQAKIATRVRIYVPLTENMPGGAANRPGDVLTARNGKTMEVLNTDAEGRLVLADGLSLAAESNPDLIVDLATLTGAAHVALGSSYAGLWTNLDAAGQLVEAAAAQAGERVWTMPLPADYRKAIDSEVADMKNTGDRYGGAIHAALFLAEFAGDGPWVHLDIAGPAWGHEKGGYLPIGGTGFGVRTLVALASMMIDPNPET